MEILNLIGANNVWEVVALDLIPGRRNLIFSPINDKDLLIMGGYGDSGYKNDSYLFKVKEKKARLFEQDTGYGLYTLNPTILQ